MHVKSVKGIYRIAYSLTRAYIILGTANLLVICWPFHIMTINGTNPLNIHLIVISIQLHNYGTRFLRLADVLLRWVRFVLIWRHISGQSHFRHSFYHIDSPAWFLAYFPTTDNGFDYPNDLCVQNALRRRLDAIETLQMKLDA